MSDFNVAWRWATHSGLSSTHDRPARVSPESMKPVHAEAARQRATATAATVARAGNLLAQSSIVSS
jgi:hypothetical protein